MLTFSVPWIWMYCPTLLHCGHCVCKRKYFYPPPPALTIFSRDSYCNCMRSAYFNDCSLYCQSQLKHVESKKINTGHRVSVRPKGIKQPRSLSDRKYRDINVIKARKYRDINVIKVLTEENAIYPITFSEVSKVVSATL